MLSYNDSASAREVKGEVARRGLCGDVYLVSTPSGARIADVKVDTSVRKGEITFDAELQGLDAGGLYTLSTRITDKGSVVREFTRKGTRPFLEAARRREQEHTKGSAESFST